MNNEIIIRYFAFCVGIVLCFASAIRLVFNIKLGFKWKSEEQITLIFAICSGLVIMICSYIIPEIMS